MIIINTFMIKRMKEKMETREGYDMDIGGCNRLCPVANGALLGYTICPVHVD